MDAAPSRNNKQISSISAVAINENGVEQSTLFCGTLPRHKQDHDDRGVQEI